MFYLNIFVRREGGRKTLQRHQSGAPMNISCLNAPNAKVDINDAKLVFELNLLLYLTTLVYATFAFL